MFFSDHGGVQWLVVFLGNPGLKYRNTRHNAGFLAADAVEKDCGVRIDRFAELLDRKKAVEDFYARYTSQTLHQP